MLAGACRIANIALQLTSAHAPLTALDHGPAAIELTQVDGSHLQVYGAARVARLGDMKLQQALSESRFAR